MAVVRVPRKLKKFTYEDVEFALRPPTVEEQKWVVSKMAEFQRSVKKDIKTDVEDNIVKESVQTGDMNIMAEAYAYVTRWLVVDPVTGEGIFSDDVADETHEHISKVPADFISAAWSCYSGLSDRQPYKVADIQDLFELEWLRSVSIVPAIAVDLKLVQLESEGQMDKVHKLRVALDLKKPVKSEVPNQDENPPKTTTVATTT